MRGYGGSKELIPNFLPSKLIAEWCYNTSGFDVFVSVAG